MNITFILLRCDLHWDSRTLVLNFKILQHFFINVLNVMRLNVFLDEKHMVEI